MRLRLHLTTRARTIPWEELHRPGRALIYSLLTDADPQLAEEIHARGWGPRRMAPFGFCPPVFPAAPRVRARYAAGGAGWMEIGTPVPRVAHALVTALTRRRVIDWGGTALHLRRLDLHAPPPTLATGRATWTTTTEIVIKNPGRGGLVWLLPGDSGWEGRLGRNLRRKAETLGLPADVTVLRALWSGPRRAHVVATGNDGRKTGARARVTLRGHPRVLAALWCWGLGEATGAGFGWIDHAEPAAPAAVHHLTQPHQQEALC